MASTVPSSNSSRSPFLDLPPELRNKIYEEALHFYPARRSVFFVDGPEKFHSPSVAFLRVNKQIHDEAAPVFHANHFIRVTTNTTLIFDSWFGFDAVNSEQLYLTRTSNCSAEPDVPSLSRKVAAAAAFKHCVLHMDISMQHELFYDSPTPSHTCFILTRRQFEDMCIAIAYANGDELKDSAHLTVDFGKRFACITEGVADDNDMYKSESYRALSNLSGLADVSRARGESRHLAACIWQHFRGFQNICIKGLASADHHRQFLIDYTSRWRWTSRNDALVSVGQARDKVRVMVQVGRYEWALDYAREKMLHLIAALEGPDGIVLDDEDDDFMNHCVRALIELASQGADIICRIASDLPMSTKRENWAANAYQILMQLLRPFKARAPQGFRWAKCHIAFYAGLMDALREKPCLEIDKKALASWDGEETWEKLLDIARETKTWPIPGFSTGFGNDVVDDLDDDEAEDDGVLKDDPSWE